LLCAQELDGLLHLSEDLEDFIEVRLALDYRRYLLLVGLQSDSHFNSFEVALERFELRLNAVVVRVEALGLVEVGFVSLPVCSQVHHLKGLLAVLTPGLLILEFPLDSVDLVGQLIDFVHYLVHHLVLEFSRHFSLDKLGVHPLLPELLLNDDVEHLFEAYFLLPQRGFRVVAPLLQDGGTVLLEGKVAEEATQLTFEL